MAKRFDGKRVVITGAGVGIGLEIAKRFVADGAVVVSADIAVTDALKQVTTSCGGGAFELDLGSRQGPVELIERAIKIMGGVDILINNLGASPVREGFLQTTDDHWERLFNINLFSMVRATRAALPSLIENQGVIVNVTSVLAREPIVIQPDYCATKAAIMNLSRNIATEFGPQGVRIVNVSPGPTLTPQWTEPGGQIEQYAERAGVSPDEALKVTIPEDLGLALRRFVQPSEIADTVLFACEATAITGTELLVDAGMRRSV
ncbi:SDR family NAD(P)-dependent oxidoreductase [Pseudahrensia aquimaris]|uniref:SDR family NAD(P)-dependent oxidoreductase n=1 Tax=Pseudahrensia aquimaris TaxID=744461 RepID=A0ABW3FD60_9HYPH